MKNARQAALEVLLKMELGHAYSTIALNEKLKKETDMEARDLALAVGLVYGVCERRQTLDYNLSRYLNKPLKKLSPTVHIILQLGAYQILFADKIPDSAAVNESIKLAKENGSAFAAGMINAVLRKIVLNGVCLPDKKDRLAYLSTLYSFDVSLVKLLTDAYGFERGEAILSAALGKKPLFIRVNTLKTTDERLTARLTDIGVTVSKTDLPHCLSLEHTGDIAAMDAFKKGEFHVQDYACQTVCSFLGAKPGDTVIDCCASPGGKSFTLAQYTEDKGKLISCDIYPHKTALIEDGCKRLGLSCIQTLCRDANTLPLYIKNADCVLCDAPCSGLGVVGRKPEIKYKNAEELAGLPEIQGKLLESAGSMVKPGGTLVYSTCTLNPAENEEVVNVFLKNHPEFSVATDETYKKYCGASPFMLMFPGETGNDGFFAAKLIKEK